MARRELRGPTRPPRGRATARPGGRELRELLQAAPSRDDDVCRRVKMIVRGT